MTEAELLFTEILNCDRVFLYQNRNLRLDKDKSLIISSVLKRRILGEPIQYILGKTEFMGLEFKITPDVFVPRPETEILVETILKIAHRLLEFSACQLRILDIGTGSGCIAISLAKFLPAAEITATDISPAALEVAKFNARLNNVEVNFLHSDLFTPLESPVPLDSKYLTGPAFQGGDEINKNLNTLLERAGSKTPSFLMGFTTYNLQPTTYDLIVSNPPYVATPEINNLQPEIRYEPRVALDGGRDGLDFYQRIIRESGDYLKENGFLIMEMRFGQKESIKNIFQDSMIIKIIEVIKDYNNIDRVIVAKKIPNPKHPPSLKLRGIVL